MLAAVLHGMQHSSGPPINALARRVDILSIFLELYEVFPVRDITFVRNYRKCNRFVVLLWCSYGALVVLLRCSWGALVVILKNGSRSPPHSLYCKCSTLFKYIFAIRKMFIACVTTARFF